MKKPDFAINSSRWKETTDNGKRVSNRGRLPRFPARKRSREAVLDMVREKVLQERETKGNYWFVTVEGIATDLRVEPHKVHWAFMKLNHEGILRQRYNTSPHESPRDTMEPGSQSAWLATRYSFKRDPDEEVPEPEESPDVPDEAGNSCFVWDEEVPPRKKRFSKRTQRRVE